MENVGGRKPFTAMVPKPSPALVFSLIVLFLAMGGSVYAASKISGKAIKKGSEPGNRIKKDTITGQQVKEESLGIVPRASHASTADLGNPLAMGRIVDGPNGTMDPATSSNLTSSRGNGQGRYCFNVISGTPRNVQVTVDFAGSPNGANAPKVNLPPTAAFGCPAGTDFQIQAYGSSTEADMSLFVLAF